MAPERRRNRGPSDIDIPPHPDHQAHAGRGQLLGIPLEGQAVDVDDALIRAPADVGVGSKSKAPVVAPALAGADLGEEGMDVGSDFRGNATGKHRLEMLAGERILPLEEKGVGEL